MNSASLRFLLLVFLSLPMGMAAAQADADAGAPGHQASSIEPKDFIAGLALLVSVTALIMTMAKSRRERLDGVIAGLRGDRRAVTYAALTIRLSALLRQKDYRRSLIASLLLAWNFETSDRARAAVLAALVEARAHYRKDYDEVVADLQERFTAYERAAPGGKIERGRTRLQDVTNAVNTASGETTQNGPRTTATAKGSS